MRIDGRALRPALDDVLRPGPRRDPGLPPGRAAEPRLGRLGRGTTAVLRHPPPDAREFLHPLTGERAHPTVLWALAALTALGVAIRFSSLGVQSYHHDEVITAARVIPGELRAHAAPGQGQRVQPAALLRARLGLGEGLRHGGDRAALALGAVRRRDRPRRLPDRPRAGEPAHGADRGGDRRRQPDADLVLAGGTLLRGAGLLRRARPALLRTRAAHARGAGPGALGDWPRRWRSAATTSPSSPSRSRRPGCSSRCARAGGWSCRRSASSSRSAWRCCR